MGAPFGLAYGIGAGLSQMPGNMRNIQAQQTTQKMRDMQLQEMQQNLEDETNTRNVMKQPWQAPPDQTITSGGEEMPAAESAPGVPAQASRSTTALDGSVTTDTDIPQTVTTPTTSRTIKAFSTPQQEQAAMLREKAQKMLGLGAWRSGMALQTQANQLDDQHNKLARIGLQRAVAMGDESQIINYLHGLGAVNAVDATKHPDGGITIVSKDPNAGTTHSVDLTQQEYEGLISGQDPAVIWANAQNRMIKQQQEQGKNIRQDKSLEQKREHEDNMVDYHDSLVQNAKDRNKLMLDNANAKTRLGGTTWQLIQERKKNMMALAEAQGEPMDEQIALAAAIKQQDTSKRANGTDPQLSIARERTRLIEAREPKIANKKTHPEYAEWKKWHDVIMGSGQAPQSETPAPTKPTAAVPATPQAAQTAKPIEAPENVFAVFNDQQKADYNAGKPIRNKRTGAIYKKP